MPLSLQPLVYLPFSGDIKKVKIYLCKKIRGRCF